MHFVVTMRTESSNFSRVFMYAIILRTWLQHICDIYEILRNFELKDFLSNCIKQHTSRTKILTNTKKFRKIKKDLIFLFFFPKVFDESRFW